MAPQRRFAALVCLAIGMALASAEVASAKIWFKGIGGRTVEHGQLVRVFVPGCQEYPVCGALIGVRVFVSPMASTRRVSRSPRRWFAGRVGAKGKLAFRVPAVPAGRYRLSAYVTWSEPPQYLAASAGFRVAETP